ncbi:hypothetical protein I7I50_11383 [Histoplasma capsulatum G186AR]|uniref:Uncharacterized protein n=1 Tax=Ajellomyces capsulatus TaxID=5037 RepID=A0A8H7Z871_AJECA|nr:hypothetical protein I7I52_02621 [Histoplasma capsulatum]QSS69929.1 hypothetical protein I7I50_11383 [Histoplasma capsulatum G186AR]
MLIMIVKPPQSPTDDHCHQQAVSRARYVSTGALAFIMVVVSTGPDYHNTGSTRSCRTDASMCIGHALLTPIVVLSHNAGKVAHDLHSSRKSLSFRVIPI